MSSNGTFSALLALCAGNSPVTRAKIRLTKPVMWNFDVFFDLRQNQQVGKQGRRRCFEMPSSWLWRHCNDPTGGVTMVYFQTDHTRKSF